MIANSNAAVDDLSQSPSFRLKGGLFPLTLLELIHCDLKKLRQDLELKVAEAPGFFQQAPAVLSLEQLHVDSPAPDLSAIRKLCSEFGLMVVALRGADQGIQDQAAKLNLALLSAGRSKTAVTIEQPSPSTDPGSNDPEPSQQNSEPSAASDSEESPEQPEAAVSAKQPFVPAKIITTPVRSGQQIYAAGGDLIVLAPVSAGAELLADGNIHVYGPVRGRVLAGVRGDRQARIFCQSLEAELVSIAGYFRVNEDLREKHWKRSVQAFLTEETLNIERLGPTKR